GWRKVPVNDSVLGYIAREKEPSFEQVFIGKGSDIKTGEEFERKLYIIRKAVENLVRDSSIALKSYFYATNISSRTLIYKGLMMPGLISEFFTDLKDGSIVSSIC